MPLRSVRNVLNQSYLARPKSSMSLNVSPAQSNVQTAITRISIRSWSLVRSTRGSESDLKCSTKLSVECFCILLYLDTTPKSTRQKLPTFLARSVQQFLISTHHTFASVHNYSGRN